MNKAKVIAKLNKDGAEIHEGNNFYGSYSFEAWLPSDKIWDCKHRLGSICIIRDRDETMESFWASVWSEISGPVIKEIK